MLADTKHRANLNSFSSFCLYKNLGSFSLKEKALIGDAYVDAGLVVISALEHPVGIVGLNGCDGPSTCES